MLRNLIFYLKLYFKITGQYIKARMQYRTDFLISIIGIIFTNIIGILFLWVLSLSIPSIGKWKIDHLMFLYGFSLLAVTPLQLFFDHIWMLRYRLQEGEFIKYYLKPLNSMFYYISEVFDLKGLGQLGFSIGILIYSSIKIGFEWTFLIVIIFILLLFSASLIMISLMIIAASTAFWITNSYSVLAFVFNFKDFSKYPLSIFNTIFRYFFTFVIPIGFVAFYPTTLLVFPEDINATIILSPFIGIALFILAYSIWKKGMNNWSGTGT
ncbi:MAG: ABC-2 family transporter protein [Candidatus Lokiarchaeota archaeon]|nr:ABC-2 family transporter protein [Candidatus Lokiarchaeota archaeon]